MLILGVDPGSIRTGYGAIDSDGRHHHLVESGTLVPPPRLPFPERLHRIHEGVATLIARLHPDCLAVEDVFHAANTRTALVLGHVRGVLLLAGAQAGLVVHSFSPATVKAQIAGFGQAEKRQVAMMVSRLLDLAQDRDPGDATDALAVALCLACTHPDSPVQAIVAKALASRPARRRA
jgi:crossover junction endodeoxyribonuclease RuvC